MATDLSTLIVDVKPKGIKETVSLLRGLAKAGKLSEEELKDLEKQLDDLGQSSQKTGSSLGAMAGKVAAVGAALAAAGIAIGVKALVSLGSSVIETGAKFETLGVQLNTVTGSAEAGAQAFEFIRKSALNMPFQVEDLTESFVLLKSMGLDPLDGTMQSIADQAAALGGGQEKLMQITLALGKAYSKGKIEGEEWNMLAEKGVPVAKLFAGALGVSEGALLDMRSAGELGRKEIKLLIDEMGEMTAGASLALMDTFEGKWSTLQDSISDTLNTIAEAGVLDLATDALDGFVQALGELDPDAIKLFADQLITSFREILPPIEAVNNILSKMVEGSVIAAESSAQSDMDLQNRKIKHFTELMGQNTQALAENNKMLLDGVPTYRNIKQEIRELTKSNDELLEKRKAAEKQLKRSTDVQERAAAIIKRNLGIVDDESDALDKNSEAKDTNAESTDALTKAEQKFEESVKDLDEQAEIRLSNFKRWKEASDELAESEAVLSAKEAQLSDYMRSSDAALAKRREETVVLTGVVHELNDAAKERNRLTAEGAKADAEAAEWSLYLAGSMRQGIANVFGDATQAIWSGEIDDLGETVIDAFSRIGEESAMGFMGALTDEIFGGEEGGISAYFEGVSQMSTAERASMGIGGAAGVYQSTQGPGGTEGAMQGAMAGAAMGTAILPGWGTAIGAVVGAIAGYLGSGDDDPITTINSAGGPGGAFTTIEALQQGLRGDDLTIARAQREISAMFRETFMSWRDIVKQFSDPSLWDNFEFPTITMDGVEMTLDAAMKHMSEVGIPDAMQEAFSEMLMTGFDNLGVDEAFITDLFSELDVMTGADKLLALSEVVGALVTISEIDATTFQSIKDTLNQSSMDQFDALTTDVIHQIDMLGMGWEDLSLTDRASEIIALGDAFGAFEQATAQMLAQIESARAGIDAMFGATAEDIMLEDMVPTGQARYYSGQITSLMDELSGAETSEDVQRIASEINRYINLLRSLDLEGTGMYPGSLGLGDNPFATWNEWLLSVLEQSQATADERLGVIEQEVRDDFDTVRQAALDLGYSFADLREFVDDAAISLERLNGALGGDDTMPDPNDTTGGTGSGGVGTINEKPGGGSTDILTKSMSEYVRQTALLAEQAVLLRQIAQNSGKPVVVNIPKGSNSTGSSRRATTGGAVY